MFYVCAVLLTAVALITWTTYGPRIAIAICWGAGVLTPTWIYLALGPLNFEARMYAGALGLVIAFADGRSLKGGWALVDVCVLGIVLAQFTTEALCDNLKLSTVLCGCLEWLVPYALGRIALQSISDLQSLTRVGAWLCLLLACWALCESIFRVNPITLILPHQGSYNAEADFRWGLRRAEGPTSHPIFFGLVLVMMLPWAFQAAAEARRNGGPHWWRALPCVVLLGVFFTMSRGPQIAACIALWIYLFLRLPAWRVRLAAVTVAAIVTGAVASSALMDGLHAWSNEGKERLVISIKGHSYEYSGTNHRFLQLLVYEDAVRNAGWFGYGAMAMRPDSTALPLDPGTLDAFRSIDNHYLHHVIRSGHLGVALFVATAVCGVLRLIRPAMTEDSQYALLAAGMCAALGAVLVVITTVWLSSDFSTLLLFALGLSVSVRACSYDPVSQGLNPPVPMRGLAKRSEWRPRLSPGHP